MIVLNAIRRVPKFKDSTADLIESPQQWLDQALARIAKKHLKEATINTAIVINEDSFIYYIF